MKPISTPPLAERANLLETPTEALVEMILRQQEIIQHLVEEVEWLKSNASSKAGDVEQLSATLQILIKDEDMRITMGENARKRVSPLSLDSYSLSLFKLYQSVFLKENLSLGFPATGNHLGKETE